MGTLPRKAKNVFFISPFAFALSSQINGLPIWENGMHLLPFFSCVKKGARWCDSRQRTFFLPWKERGKDRDLHFFSFRFMPVPMTGGARGKIPLYCLLPLWDSIKSRPFILFPNRPRQGIDRLMPSFTQMFFSKGFWLQKIYICSREMEGAATQLSARPAYFIVTFLGSSGKRNSSSNGFGMGEEITMTFL